MKKIFVFIFCVFTAVNVFGQAGKPSSGIYAGLGYSAIFFTNSQVSDIYPAFDFKRNSLKSEINPFIGYKPTPLFSLEFSPSFLNTNSSANTGFTFSSNGQYSSGYYVPAEANLFMMPLNFKMRIFPFAAVGNIIGGGIFFSGGGGPVYVREEYTNYVYTDQTMTYQQGISTAKNSFWTGNFEFSAGYMASGLLSYGFEVGYRMITLKPNRQFPVITDVSGNLNSIFASIKLSYGF